MDRREAQRLRRRNQQLEEENNLLRLKVDILLDMVRKVAGKGCLGFPFREVPPSSFLLVYISPCLFAQVHCLHPNTQMRHGPYL